MYATLLALFTTKPPRANRHFPAHSGTLLKAYELRPYRTMTCPSKSIEKGVVWVINRLQTRSIFSPEDKNGGSIRRAKSDVSPYIAVTASERSRTSTSKRTQGPKPCASASSATLAHLSFPRRRESISPRLLLLAVTGLF